MTSLMRLVSFERISELASYAPVLMHRKWELRAMSLQALQLYGYGGSSSSAFVRH